MCLWCIINILYQSNRVGTRCQRLLIPQLIIFNIINKDIIQPMVQFKFQVAYQYRSERVRESIFNRIAKDFIVPSWIQRYHQITQKNDSVQMFRMIDQKVLKFNLEQTQWIQLQQNLEPMQQILNNYKNASFLEKACLHSNWPIYLQMINRTLKRVKQEGQPEYNTLIKYLQMNAQNYSKIIYFYKQGAQEELYFMFRIPLDCVDCKNCYKQKDYIFSSNGSVYPIEISIIMEQLQFHQETHQIKGKSGVQDEKNINISLFKFAIEDKQSFFGVPSNKDSVFIDCHILECKSEQNSFSYLHKEFYLREDVKFQNKHYSLAFQGGGAKGLAYVGAYRAIEQNKVYTSDQNGQESSSNIEIKNIMGSSAGGITAIAASTGMTHSEIQKICNKMNTIPKTDRIINDQSFDQYGNKITFQFIMQQFRKLSLQFGLFDNSMLNIIKDFKDIYTEIQPKLIGYLKVAFPSVVDIFDNNGTINWNGILLHGALMQGKAIHDIAAQCLIRYFLKNSFENNFYEKLRESLLQQKCMEHPYVYSQNSNTLIPNKTFSSSSYMNKISKDDLIKFLDSYKEITHKLLFVPLLQFTILQKQDEKKRLEQKKKRFLQFIVNIVNKSMINLNDYVRSFGKNGSLNINKIKFQHWLQISSNYIKKNQKKSQIVGQIIKQKRKLQNQLQQILTYIEINMNQQNYPIEHEENHQYFRTCKTKKQSHQIRQQYELTQKLIKKKLSLIKNLEDLQIILSQQGPITMANYFKIELLTNGIDIVYGQDKNKQMREQFELEFRKDELKVSQILACNTYNQLTSCTNNINLLNYEHFCLDNTHDKQHVNAIQLVLSIFGEGIDRSIMPQQVKQIQTILQKYGKAYTLSLTNIDKFDGSLKEKANAKELKLLFFLYDLSDELWKFPQLSHTLLKEKKTNEENLINEVSKLTMKQYYSMNPIELTCTSVDLDNKVLRLFNHKTTPDLPACFAVQMTGSFPVAFKAQRWQREWGYYYVHHENIKTVVDITGHEFTDGGLLANFPIKYFDNQVIRRSYFSHSNEKGKSILLGFGLDQLSSGSYQQDLQQIRQSHKKKVEIELALQSIKQKFHTSFNLWQKVKVFFKTGPNEEETQWGELNLHIIEEIPIVRFISKLITAYPNADRNLNLQAFSQSIMVQDLRDTNLTPTNQLIINNEQTDEFKESQSKLKCKRKQSYQKQFKKRKEQERQWKILSVYREYQFFKRAIQPPEESQKTRENAKKKSKGQLSKEWEEIQSFFQLQTEYECNVMSSMIKGYQSLNWFGFARNPNKTSQMQMSLLLIKMLMVTLRTQKKQNNSQSAHQIINQTFSKRFAYFSFLAKYYQKYRKQKTPIQMEGLKDMNYSLNRQSYTSLYNNYNFQEIEKHLDFFKFKEEYNKLHKGKGPFIEFSTAITQEQKHNRQDLSKNLNQKNKRSFAEFPLFDVSSNMQRLTQYLYYQIRGQKLVDKKNIGSLFKKDEGTLSPFTIINNQQKFMLIDQHIKRNNYENLINPVLNSELSCLSCEEILQFMWNINKKGLMNDQKIVQIKYVKQFENYLDNVIHNKQKRNLINFNYGLDLFTNNMQTSQQKQQICLDLQQKFQLIPKLHEFIDQLFLLEQVKSLAISSLDQIINIKKKKKKKKDTHQTHQAEKFLSFLWNKLQFQQDKLEQMSIEKEIKLKNLQIQARNCLKSLIFGQNLEDLSSITVKGISSADNLGFISNALSNFKQKNKENKQNMLALKTNSKIVNKPAQDKKHSQIQVHLLENFYCRMIHEQVESEIISKKEKNNQLCICQQIFMQDMQHFLQFLRKMILLLAYNQNKQEKQLGLVQKFKLKYAIISQQFLNKYQYYLNLADNFKTIQTLNEVFLISYTHLHDLISYMGTMKNNRFQTPQKQLRIKKTINKFNLYKFSLPLFMADWQLLLNVNLINFYSKESPLARYDQRTKKIIMAVTEKGRNRNIISKIFEKANLMKIDNHRSSLHLVVEGVTNSAQYIAAYYYYIQGINLQASDNQNRNKLQQNSQKKDNFKIEWITGNSVFGFLLALGQNIDQIRSNMYRVRNYLYQMFDKKKIDAIVEKHGASGAPNNYSGLIDCYTQEITNVIKQFELEYQQKVSGKGSYSKVFDDIRLIFEEQKQYYFQTCNQILDQSAEEIKNIEKDYLHPQMANEIAKKFAFDYTCRFNEKHNYKHYNQKAKQQYLKIMNEVYSHFGSVVGAIWCNIMCANSPLVIQQKNVKQFSKGLLIARLLTVYKMKAFIIGKLEENGLPYNITLSQFYQRCKNKISLNYPVINFTDQRLDFLNRLTTPKMPVWAAILASSTLPVIHRYFSCEREWEGQDTMQTMKNEMIQFFKNQSFAKRKIILYNSAVYISSLPMQLLTNSTIFQNKQSNKRNNLIIGLAFNANYSTNLLHYKIKKNYFNLSFQMVWKFFTSGSTGTQITTSNDKSQHSREHYNKSYEARYNPIDEFVTLFLKKSATTRTLKTLTESNDNLIMKWYYDKLIRLPIKIGTLAFNQTVDINIEKKYKMQVLSSKAQDSLLRSYEITKTFIHNIHNRQLRTRQDYIQQFTVKLRTQIITIPIKNSSQTKDYMKVTFLNHSKWNQNMFNNFIIEYSIIEHQHSNKRNFLKSDNSEIVWNIQMASSLIVRFYYLNTLHNNRKLTIYSQQITQLATMFTEFKLDFSQIYQKHPSKNGYDYQFNYNQNEYMQNIHKKKLIDQWRIKNQKEFYNNAIKEKQKIYSREIDEELKKRAEKEKKVIDEMYIQDRQNQLNKKLEKKALSNALKRYDEEILKKEKTMIPKEKQQFLMLKLVQEREKLKINENYIKQTKNAIRIKEKQEEEKQLLKICRYHKAIPSKVNGIVTTNLQAAKLQLLPRLLIQIQTQDSGLNETQMVLKYNDLKRSNYRFEQQKSK